MALEGVTVGGGFLGDIPVVFSPNNRYVFVTTSCKVRVVSVATGEVVRFLVGHGLEITSMVINPANSYQLITGSMDGTIKIWDYTSVNCLRTIDVDLPVAFVGFLAGSPDSLYYAACSAKRKKNAQPKHKTIIFRVVLSDTASVPERVHSIKHVATLAEGRIMTAIHGNSVTFINPKEEGDITKVSVHTHTCSHAITALACHPTQPGAATGDVRGVITLWHSWESEKAITSTMHWHAHGVSTLRFTSDGSYLLSGGDEGVLVLWQVETRTKRFLPRLGAPLTSISVSADDVIYAVGLRNNTIQLRDASTLAQIRSFAGVNCAADGDLKGSRSKLVVEPRTNLVALNTSSDGKLQFYNPWKDIHSFELQVSRRNFLTRKDGQQIFPTSIDHVAFTSTGQWLISIESQKNRILQDCKMKFWELTPNSEDKYIMKTCVNLPHNTATVNAIAVHPSEPVIVTCGSDAQFKIWAYTSSGDKKAWECIGVGTYKGNSCTAASFSLDGSLIAVAFDKTLTLWDSHGQKCRQTLVHTPNTKATTIRGVYFVKGMSKLITYTQQHVYVWNLLECSVSWCMEIEVLHIAVATQSPQFSVITTGGRLVTFDVATHVPKAMMSLNCPGAPVSMVYLTDSVRPEHLMIFDDHVSFTAIFPSDAEVESLRKTVLDDVNEALAPLSSDLSKSKRAQQSLLNQVLGSMDPNSSSKSAPSKPNYEGSDHVQETFKQILDGPTHVLPSIDTLYQQVVSVCLGTSSTESHLEEQETNKHDNDSDEEEEDVEPVDTMQDMEPLNFNFMVGLFQTVGATENGT